MRSQKIGYSIGFLRSWLDRHLFLALFLYTVALSALTFILAVAFLFQDNFSFELRAWVFYFYFWISFYVFANILARIARQDTERHFEHAKDVMMKANHHHPVLDGLQRSRELTIPRTERIWRR